MAKKLAFIAVLATIVAGPTDAAASLKPPVISEQFTLLPCPAKPKTTLDMEGCAEHRIVRSDAAINARVRAIFFLLKKFGASRRKAASSTASVYGWCIGSRSAKAAPTCSRAGLSQALWPPTARPARTMRT